MHQAPPAPPAPQHPIRLVIQQPALPAYRLPVFAQLARRPGIDLRVLYASSAGLPNVPPQGFCAQPVPMQRRNILGHPLLWHQPQWTCAHSDHADVLILSWNVRYASLIPSLLRAKANGVPTILWGHGYSKTEAPWRSGPRRKVAQLATALLFYNHTAAQRYLDTGWDPARIFVALNSLDQEPIRHARQHWLDNPAKLAAFRDEQGLGTGPLVLFVSRLEADNRVDLLLQSTRLLLDGQPNLKVIIVGRGEQMDPLQRLAADLSLQDHVRFLGPIYGEEQLAPWFMAADVFCYPANIGLSLLHAFGYGLPVITSDNTASQNPEIEALRPGQNGLLYKDGDADALAGAMQTLFENPVLRQQMADEALRTVTEQFTLSNMVDGMESAVRYCAGQSAARAE